MLTAIPSPLFPCGRGLTPNVPQAMPLLGSIHTVALPSILYLGSSFSLIHTGIPLAACLITGIALTCALIVIQNTSFKAERFQPHVNPLRLTYHSYPIPFRGPYPVPYHPYRSDIVGERNTRESHLPIYREPPYVPFQPRKDIVGERSFAFPTRPLQTDRGFPHRPLREDRVGERRAL